MSATIQRWFTIRQVAVGVLIAALLTAAPLPWALQDLSAHPTRFVAFLAADEIQGVSFANGGAAPLFGMNTEPVIEGDVLAKWTRVKADIDRELDAVTQCRASGACSPAAERLLELSVEGVGRSGRARVGLINRAVDLAIGPESDETQWGVQDHWSSPFETLQSNRGDCEDYAIVKYLVLRAAGISQDDVKIVIQRDTFPHEDHATLAARVDGQWLILDNRTLTLVRDTDVVRTIPRFVLDQHGARRFVWDGRTRRGGALSGT